MTTFLTIFRRFPKILQTLSEDHTKISKITADYETLPKTFEEDPKMFWSYTNEFKVAPYSFTIARAHRKKAQVICARSKENVGVFRFLWRQHELKKQKRQWIFSRFLRWIFLLAQL